MRRDALIPSRRRVPEGVSAPASELRSVALRGRFRRHGATRTAPRDFAATGSATTSLARLGARARFFSIFGLIQALVLLFFANGSPLAQDSPEEISAGDRQVPVEIAELEKRVARLREELIEVQQEADAARVAWSAEETQLESRIESLASEITERAIVNARSRAERAELDTKHVRLAEESALLETAFRQAEHEARDLAEQTGLLASETPGLDAYATAAERIVPILARGDRELDAPLVLDESVERAWTELVEIANAMHALGSGASLRESTITTASDRRERVELLSAGAVAYAYRTLADGRIGWSVSSPADASGYRFTEDLDTETRETLEAAFADAKAGREEITVPTDVSGTLTIESTSPVRDLWTILRSGGPVMVPIGLVALLSLLLVLERAWTIVRESGNGDARLRKVLEHCRVGRHGDGLELARSTRGFVARSLAAGLAARSRGVRAMEDAIEARLIADTPRLERGLSFLSVLGSVAPLLGLLGTITGIIQTFTAVRVFRSTDPSLLAGGISEALVTTAAGLIVAIPTVLAHGWLSGRVEGILSNAERHAAALLTEIDWPAEGPIP
jgi:biopolymer transport protein ExbB